MTLNFEEIETIARTIAEHDAEHFKANCARYEREGHSWYDAAWIEDQTMKHISRLSLVNAFLKQSGYVIVKADEIEALREKTALSLGVGSGDGQLFVHGDYDSITAMQRIIFEWEKLRASKNEVPGGV